MNPATSPLPAAVPNPPTVDEPRCPNCREPLLGEFCYACGQPKKGFIRHLSGIIGDFLDTVFNIDSRTLRTVLPLFFRPGFLSIEYFEGRRVRYVTPLRLYFFFSVLAFLAVSWVTHVENTKNGGSNLYVDDSQSPGVSPQKLEKQRDQALQGLETGRPFMGEAAFQQARDEINKRFEIELEKSIKQTVDKAKSKAPVASAPAGSTPAEAVVAANDPASMPKPPEPAPPPKTGQPVRTKAAGTSADNDQDDDDDLTVTLGNGKTWNPLQDPIQISWLNDAGNDWLTRQARRIVTNAQHVDDDPNRFLAQVFSQAPQVLFVILPLFALMLKFFYVFKRRLYMEHLIVALHSHSFLCLSILLLAGISALMGAATAGTFWLSSLGFAKVVILWWIPIYLLIAQKRIYRQGWPMTLLKFGMIGIAYSVMITFGIVINMMVSLASL